MKERFAAIQPHSDDIPIFAGGLVAKLIREGYKGYLIRTTNDDAAGIGKTRAETVLNNERDTQGVAKALGLEKVYDLSYRNHNLHEVNMQEITGRFVFLIRMLKIDTIILVRSVGAVNTTTRTTTSRGEPSRRRIPADWTIPNSSMSSSLTA